MEIKNYYLNKELTQFQYMHIYNKHFAEELCAEYNIERLAEHDRYVYCKIQKDMYGLKEARWVAF